MSVPRDKPWQLLIRRIASAAIHVREVMALTYSGSKAAVTPVGRMFRTAHLLMFAE